jgi:hypothetical protein
MGIGMTAGIAVLAFATKYGIDTDFSRVQFAESVPKCDPKTFGNAIPALITLGLLVETAPHVFEGKKNPNNRRAIYHFTEKLYAMIHSTRKAQKHPKKREKFPMPLDLSVPICVPHSNPNHNHLAPDREDGHGPQGTKNETLKEGATPAVLETLVQLGGLDREGAIKAALAIPKDKIGEKLPFLIQAAKEEVNKRRDKIRKTPEAYLHYLLTSKDRDVYRAADALYEKSKTTREKARQSGADQVWMQASASFREMPGAQEALTAWVVANAELGQARAKNADDSHCLDQVFDSRSRVAQLAARAAGLGERPNNLIARQTWAFQALKSAGLA